MEYQRQSTAKRGFSKIIRKAGAVDYNCDSILGFCTDNWIVMQVRIMLSYEVRYLQHNDLKFIIRHHQFHRIPGSRADVLLAYLTLPSSTLDSMLKDR